MIVQDAPKGNFLKPLTGRIINRALWGFDIETHGIYNKFVMGSIVGDKNVKEVFWDKEEFIDYLISKYSRIFRSGYITATNLGFDLMGLLTETQTIKQLSPVINGSNFIIGCIHLEGKKKLNFIDTMSYYHFSVKKWGEILGIPKLNTPKFLGCRPKNDEQREELQTYNIRDSTVTYQAIKFLQEGFNKLGCNLKPTIASSAMDLYRRKYMTELYFQPKRQELLFLYSGYYGGRTEIIKRGRVKNLNYYDVNSLYPSVMINKYPSPTKFIFTNSISLSAIYKYEGLVKVRVKAPDLYIPYLPVRQPKPDVKLIFPIGEFIGVYTFFEIRKAIELGYKIKNIYSGVIYFETCYPFKKYVEELYPKRLEYKANNDEQEVIIKLFLNGLYGKFAQKILYKDKIIHESKTTLEMINKYETINSKGDFFIFRDRNPRIPKFVNPIFSIYTTAYARDKLFDLMMKDEKKVYYYDTDSLMTKKTYETSQTKLGYLKEEDFIKDGILVKPKMYIINDFSKCKGLSKLTKQEFLEVLFSGKSRIRRFTKFKEANRRNLHYNQIIELDKMISLEDTKRVWCAKFNPDELQESEPLSI